MVVLAARSISKTKRVRYLLGLSSPAEREHIELQYFEDEDAFQEMLTAEDDLIDAYARGELSGEERRRFEKSFMSSLGGRDRVQFARAFPRAVSATPSVETKLSGTLLDIFKTFPSPGLLRAATIAAVIVFVAVLSWLVTDRMRINNEPAELSKRTESLQRGSDTEGRRATEMAPQLADLRAQPEKPKRERRIIATQRAISKPEQSKKPLNTSDPTLGNSFEPKRITELPLNANNVVGLLSLQPANSGPVDQSNITLDVVDATIRIQISPSWTRFQIALGRAAVHEDYRVIIKTADGRPVTSVDWMEPLTPNQTIIDTPVISTGDLPSSDYVLLLMGKEPDGSFVKVAEWSFKVIKY